MLTRSGAEPHSSPVRSLGRALVIVANIALVAITLRRMTIMSLRPAGRRRTY